MKRSILAIALACLAATAVAEDRVEVATVSALKGSVLVNSGSQFVPAGQGEILAEGDRVMVAGEGSAEVTFKDGCKMAVKARTMVTITAKSVCAGGAVLVQNTEPVGAGALGDAAPNPLVWGSAFVAAGAAATYVIVHNSNSNNPKPISP